VQNELTKLGKATYVCNISYKSFAWFLSIGIIHLKAGAKVTERPTEDAMDVSTNKLQQKTNCCQHLTVDVTSPHA